MTALATVPTAALDESSARALTADLNAKIDDVLDLLLKAWLGRAWLALGYKTWRAYLDAEVPGLKNLRLATEDRQEAVALWSTHGAPQRDMAAAFNVSNGSIASDVAKVVPFDPAARVRSKDGSSRARRVLKAAPEPTPAQTLRERIIDLCAAAGSRGMTRKELIRALKKDGGTISGALTPLAKAGRLIVDTDADKRDGCAPYLVPAPVEVSA